MLQNWTRRRSTAQVLALRARIVLACAEPGITNRAVGARLEVCEMTVSKWRRRFAALGVDGLVDAPRSGAPRTILDDQVERVIVTTLESVPKNATHFIANCRDETTTLGQLQRFLQWLEQEGEDRRLAGRAGARRRITDLIAKEQ